MTSIIAVVLVAIGGLAVLVYHFKLVEKVPKEVIPVVGYILLGAGALLFTAKMLVWIILIAVVVGGIYLFSYRRRTRTGSGALVP